jgi:hypothetical protein
MPKKSTATRGGTQRQKPKTQKNFELVRPVTPVDEVNKTSEEQFATAEEQNETAVSSTQARTARGSAAITTNEVKLAPDNKEEKLAPGSAAARIAARRQATQRIQQRNVQSLLSPEHFAYVSRDLITIAVLACLMLAIVIVLYFVIGRSV